jgi:hypothetical protein
MSQQVAETSSITQNPYIGWTRLESPSGNIFYCSPCGLWRLSEQEFLNPQPGHKSRARDRSTPIASSQVCVTIPLGSLSGDINLSIDINCIPNHMSSHPSVPRAKIPSDVDWTDAINHMIEEELSKNSIIGLEKSHLQGWWVYRQNVSYMIDSHSLLDCLQFSCTDCSSQPKWMYWVDNPSFHYTDRKHGTLVFKDRNDIELYEMELSQNALASMSFT